MNNTPVEVIKEELLSDNWYILKKITYRYRTRAGEWKVLTREAYDRGNGAVILLYNPQENKVILTRQFRLPTYVNGNKEGWLMEACAGLLDNDTPEVAIRRETEEETGLHIEHVDKIFEAYMSPGSVTEKLYFFIGHYTSGSRITAGGGVDDEDIEVVELSLSRAMEMIKSGEIRDGKTIMLLQHVWINKLTAATMTS